MVSGLVRRLRRRCAAGPARDWRAAGHIAASARCSRWSSRPCSAARPGSVDWRAVSWARSDWSWLRRAVAAASWRLALGHHRAQRDVGGVGHAAGIAASARSLRGIRAQPRDLLAGGDDVGMRFGPAAGEVLVDLALELGDLAGGGAAIVAADAGDGLRRRGELAAHRVERAPGRRRSAARDWRARCARADIRSLIEPVPGSTPMKRCSNSTRRCSASLQRGLAAAQLLVEEAAATGRSRGGRRTGSAR